MTHYCAQLPILPLTLSRRANAASSLQHHDSRSSSTLEEPLIRVQCTAEAVHAAIPTPTPVLARCFSIA